MNKMQFTNRAQKALEEAMSSARMNSNTTVELEHLFRALIRERNVLHDVLAADEVAKIASRLDAIISGFARASGQTQDVSASPQLGRLLQSAAERAGGCVSVPLLLLMLLEDRRMADNVPNIEEVKKVLKKAATAAAGSPEGDDPSDKMGRFAVEMVEEARQNRYDPVIGRDDEIRQVIEVLAKKTKSNAMLVGKPGVGKTAVVRGIAQIVARGESKVLEGFKIYSVDVGAMVAGSAHRGAFEERLKDLVSAATSDRKVILFIDEIHVVLGAGACDGSLDAANILKPGLADGSLRVIGATTHDEFRKYVAKDPAFERRFTRVSIREPSVEDTVTVLRGLRARIESHHGVKIADRALVYAASAGKRYIPNRRHPDLAIDLVDTACAAAIISLNSEPPAIATLRSRLWGLELEKTSLEMDFQNRAHTDDAKESLPADTAIDKKIAAVKEELKALEDAYNAEKGHLKEARELKQRLEEAVNRMEQAKRENDRYLVYDLQTNIIPIYEKRLAECNEKVEVIDERHVAEIISRLSGVPVSRLSGRESERLLTMGDRIRETIFGQDEAVDRVVSAVLASRAGLCAAERPIGSFLFLGPTGVGKTALAKALCRELNGTADNMVVLDMSDYASELSLSKLIGAPAGYVGCEEGGSLTEPVREMPHTVVLLDEIDLAHRSVLNVLYQLLDEGRVTDGRGIRVSFRDAVVILTSNICAGEMDESALAAMASQCLGRPLINRIDCIVPFNDLGPAALASIFRREIHDLNTRLSDKNGTFAVSPAVEAFSVAAAEGSGFGARIIRRFVKDNLTTPLSRMVLSRQGEEPFSVQCFMRSEDVGGYEYGGFTFLLHQ